MILLEIITPPRIATHLQGNTEIMNESQMRQICRTKLSSILGDKTDEFLDDFMLEFWLPQNVTAVLQRFS